MTDQTSTNDEAGAPSVCGHLRCWTPPPCTAPAPIRVLREELTPKHPQDQADRGPPVAGVEATLPPAAGDEDSSPAVSPPGPQDRLEWRAWLAGDQHGHGARPLGQAEDAVTVPRE